MLKLFYFLFIAGLLSACNNYNSESDTLLDQLNTEDKEYFKLIDLNDYNSYYNKDVIIYNNVILLFKNKAGE